MAMFGDIFPRVRSFTDAVKFATALLAIGISSFHLYTGAFGIFEAYMMRSVHLMTLLTLAFLFYPASKKWSREKSAMIDIPLALICLIIDIYLLANHDRIVSREWYTGPMTGFDVAFGWITMILILEATRRVAGFALPTVAIVFIFYTLFGQFLPYPFTIKSPPLGIFIDHMFLTPHAIFGVPIGVSATFVFLFILFAALLNQTGAGKFIINFSLAVVGWATGGPAKVAVIASALFGTISGHSVANVYGTGTFTIPLMKKMGYKPEYAGAVEAAASAGGQIMPPIMGAAAFIMAEIIGVSYISICKAAILPALLYFTAVFVSTHIEAVKLGLKGLSRTEIPDFKETVYGGFHFIVPIFLLIFILIRGFTPFRAAFMAIIALMVVAMARKSSRLNLGEFLQALINGARNAVVIASCCACAGIVVGCLDSTGLGLKFVDIITALSRGIFPALLLMVMVACLILGMGVPTAPAYIISAMVAAPALIKAGLTPISAHMFVFYSCLLSAITPPVALAAYAGAAIAEADVMKTGFQASKLGFVKFFVPYVFAYDAALLIMGTPGFIVLSFATAFTGTVMLSAAIEGFLFTSLSTYTRAVLAIGSVMLLISGIFTDILGVIILAIGILANYRSSRAIQKTQWA
jgi:TRAP transporter 4TM/12TM fusion protein